MIGPGGFGPANHAVKRFNTGPVCKAKTFTSELWVWLCQNTALRFSSAIFSLFLMVSVFIAYFRFVSFVVKRLRDNPSSYTSTLFISVYPVH